MKNVNLDALYEQAASTVARLNAVQKLMLLYALDVRIYDDTDGKFETVFSNAEYKRLGALYGLDISFTEDELEVEVTLENIPLALAA